MKVLRLQGACNFRDSVSLFSFSAPSEFRAYVSPPSAFLPQLLLLTVCVTPPYSAPPRRLLVLWSIFKRKQCVENDRDVAAFPLPRAQRPPYPPPTLQRSHPNLPRTRREEGDEMDEVKQGGGFREGLLDALNVPNCL